MFSQLTLLAKTTTNKIFRHFLVSQEYPDGADLLTYAQEKLDEYINKSGTSEDMGSISRVALCSLQFIEDNINTFEKPDINDLIDIIDGEVIILPNS